MATTTKNDQLAKQRAKRATASKAKASAKSTAKKSTAKSAVKKSTAKSTAAKATRRGTSGPRTKGARYHFRQIAADAVKQGLIEDYSLRGLGDEDLPVTLIPSKKNKSTRVRFDFPKTALEYLVDLGYKPSDGVAASVEAIGA